MTYDEMSEYILGNKYLGDIQHLDSIDIEMVNRAKHYLNGLLKPIDLSVFNLPNDFYKAFPDIKEMTPAVWREELFYALRNDGVSPVVPCKVIFLIKRAYKQYNSPNMLWAFLSDKEKEMMFRSGVLGKDDKGVSYTLRDVVRNFCDRDYEPVSSTNLRNKLESHTEIYAPRLDAVAMLSHDIADALTDKDIMAIDVDSLGGLNVKGNYLSTLAGHRGGVNSIYDLRNVV